MTSAIHSNTSQAFHLQGIQQSAHNSRIWNVVSAIFDTFKFLFTYTWAGILYPLHFVSPTLYTRYTGGFLVTTSSASEKIKSTTVTPELSAVLSEVEPKTPGHNDVPKPTSLNCGMKNLCFAALNLVGAVFVIPKLFAKESTSIPISLNPYNGPQCFPNDLESIFGSVCPIRTLLISPSEVLPAAESFSYLPYIAVGVPLVVVTAFVVKKVWDCTFKKAQVQENKNSREILDSVEMIPNQQSASPKTPPKPLPRPDLNSSPGPITPSRGRRSSIATPYIQTHIKDFESFAAHPPLTLTDFSNLRTPAKPMNPSETPNDSIDQSPSELSGGIDTPEKALPKPLPRPDSPPSAQTNPKPVMSSFLKKFLDMTSTNQTPCNSMLAPQTPLKAAPQPPQKLEDSIDTTPENEKKLPPPLPKTPNPTTRLKGHVRSPSAPQVLSPSKDSHFKERPPLPSTLHPSQRLLKNL